MHLSRCFLRLCYNGLLINFGGAPVKKELGRPTLLTDEVREKAKEYLLFGYKDQGNTVPSVAGLGCYLGFSRSTIQEWAKIDGDISGTLESIKTKQEMMLIDGGLNQTFSGTITKLMLSNHGYSEKIETDITTNGESVNKPTRIELVAPSVSSSD